MSMHRDVGRPLCTLCSGVLVEESKVVVGETEIGVTRFRRAWVCRECSAAWPIAVKAEGFLGRKERPLYRRGERAG